MNLKERGITVGDLIIILITILASTIIVNSFKKDKNTTHNNSTFEKVSYKKSLISKIH